MAPDEVTTDIPEHRELQPKPYWDKRARGLGATAARHACSVSAENLLGLNHVNTRKELKEYDPALYGLIEAAFNKADWLWKYPAGE